jgi:hypothetical protein
MEKVTEKLKNLNIDPKNIKGEYSVSEAPGIPSSIDYKINV